MNLFTEIVQSLSEWSIKLVLVKQKDWKTEFFQPHWTMSNEQHLHMASLLDRTNMAVVKKNPIKLGIFRKLFLPIYPLFSPATVIHCFSVDFLSLDKKKTMKDWAFTTESSKIDNRKQKRKLSQQPVTVKSVAPSTVHANDWPTSPAKTAVKPKLRTMIYQNWLTNEVRRLISLNWWMFKKKREVILVKKKDWKADFSVQHGTMSKE